jgi:uroporphyrinogen decarboxylase
MDPTAVRRQFGRNLRLWGGVDKRAVAKGAREMASRSTATGGSSPTAASSMLDHSAPPDIPFANYRYFMQQLRKAL